MFLNWTILYYQKHVKFPYTAVMADIALLVNNNLSTFLEIQHKHLHVQSFTKGVLQNLQHLMIKESIQDTCTCTVMIIENMKDTCTVKIHNQPVGS